MASSPSVDIKVSKAVTKMLDELTSCKNHIVRELTGKEMSIDILGAVFDAYIETRKSGKKSKKSVDPNKPKKAPNAYNTFCAEAIKRIRSENPGMSAKSAMGLAGKEWTKKKEADGIALPAKNEVPEVAENNKSVPVMEATKPPSGKKASKANKV